MVFYPLDDVILCLDAKKISKCRVISHFLLFGVFLFYICFKVVPSVYQVMVNQQVFEQEKDYFRRSQELSKKVRKELAKYRRLKQTLDRYMGLDTPYINSKVFDTIVSLLHNVGIYDVYLKIGKIRIERTEGICFVVVPVQIKAYMEYPQLAKFFKVLNQNLVYQVQRLEIKWSDEYKKEKVLLDVDMIFKYKKSQLPLTGGDEDEG